MRLRQILVNLLGNAIKFTERGEVRLALRWLREAPGGPRMQFAVSDTGIGIAPEKLGELFQPFTQADASLTRRYGGTGLGLAISQRLAKALGGDIEVRSALGQGSTFTLTVSAGPLQGVRLRRGPPAPAPASEEPSPGEPEVRLRGRVLLVEDVPDLHHMLRQMLGKMGLEVEIAENGRRACQMAQHSQAEARPYDLILMDIQMPEMNGFEATRWLREHGWQGAIVALTAHAMVGDREKCLAAGCDEYLSKPVNAAGLEAIVARYLGREETAADACPAAAQAGAEPAGPLGGGLLDPAAAAELLAAFAGELPGRVKCMEDALREGDLPRLQALAHQLKGTAGVYGFPRLSEAAEVVHQRATEEDDVQRLHAAVAELAALCAEAAAAR